MFTWQSLRINKRHSYLQGQKDFAVTEQCPFFRDSGSIELIIFYDPVCPVPLLSREYACPIRWPDLYIEICGQAHGRETNIEQT